MLQTIPPLPPDVGEFLLFPSKLMLVPNGSSKVHCVTNTHTHSQSASSRIPPYTGTAYKVVAATRVQLYLVSPTEMNSGLKN